MSLLSLGGFNLLCYWAGVGSELWDQIEKRMNFVREVATVWISEGAKEHKKIQTVLTLVDQLQKNTPTIVTEIGKNELIDIINRCEAPVCLIGEIAETATANPHAKTFINQSCNIVEDILTLSEEIIKRLPGESESSAAAYTKHIDDCLSNVLSF